MFQFSFILLSSGLSVNKILSFLEDDDDECDQICQIGMRPPVNANTDLTDLDFGDEIDIRIENLRGLQLQNEALVEYFNGEN